MRANAELSACEVTVHAEDLETGRITITLQPRNNVNAAAIAFGDVAFPRSGFVAWIGCNLSSMGSTVVIHMVDGEEFDGCFSTAVAPGASVGGEDFDFESKAKRLASVVTTEAGEESFAVVGLATTDTDVVIAAFGVPSGRSEPVPLAATIALHLVGRAFLAA